MTRPLHMGGSFAGTPSEPAASCEQAFAQRRFLAVHFTHWRLDASRSMLRRALLRMTGGSARAGGDGAHDATSAAYELLCAPFLLIEGSRGRDQTHDQAHDQAHDHVQDRIVAACVQCMSCGVREGITPAQAEAICPPFQPSPSMRECLKALCSDHDSVHDSFHDSFHGSFHGSIAVSNSGLWWSRCVSWGGCALVMRADRARESRLFVRLAHCLERWIPRVAFIGPSGDAGDPSRLEARATQDKFSAGAGIGRATLDGPSPQGACLVGDLTGCQRLFRKAHGTEQALMRRIASSFRMKGFHVRVATASTIGASVAAALHGGHRSRGVEGVARDDVRAVPAGREEEHLDSLPVAALRVPAAAIDALDSVGVRTVGQLLHLRREGVAARLGGNLVSIGPGRRQGVSRGGRRHVASPARWEHEAGLFHAGESSSQEPMPSSQGRGSRRTQRADASVLAPDVLLRLDQALGRAPEELVPLRSCDEVVLRRDFDGPVARLEAILVACGELVDRLARHLRARGEALRSARWVFRHAPLPADLSTDVQQTHRSIEATSRSSAAAGLESTVMLSLVSPSARRTVLWRLLHPRVERLALDHGVEAIRCHLEDAVRLRSSQRHLLARVQSSREGPKQRLPATHARRQAKAAACTMPTVGVESDLPAGWVEVGSSSETRIAPEDTGIMRGETRQWIDLLAARGVSVSIGRQAWRDTPHGMEGRRVGNPRACASRVRLSVERPSVEFDPPEPAYLRGGSTSIDLAHCIAKRTAWHAPYGVATDSADLREPAASVDWRGRTWRLHVLDGWERIASPWWSHVEVCAGPRAEAGRLYARLRIAGGLWAFVRWPETLRCRGAVGGPASHAMDQSAEQSWFISSSLRSSCFNSPCLNSPCLNSLWIVRSAEAMRRGVELEVLGVWG